MTAHTRKRFEHGLRTLRERLATMGQRCSRHLEMAMRALADRDDELAREVIAADELVDADENDIDELALQILATYQPVASDLRFLAMALKMVIDLERIGDLASGIAKRALEISPLSPMSNVNLHELAALVQANLHAVLDAFVKRDAVGATAVIAADVEIDEVNARPVRGPGRTGREGSRDGDPDPPADVGVPLPRADRRSRREHRRGGRVHGQRRRPPAPRTAGRLARPDHQFLARGSTLASRAAPSRVTNRRCQASNQEIAKD